MMIEVNLDILNFDRELRKLIDESEVRSLFLQGIRVQVRSVYIEGRSQPAKGQHFFAYRIRITNNSDRPVQLLRRHWIVTDANGKSENVWLVKFSFPCYPSFSIWAYQLMKICFHSF